MNRFKIIPQLRENCVLTGTEDLLDIYDMGEVIYLISDNPAKRFSVISKIEGKMHDTGEPNIIIDKRILGQLSENDWVKVLKYNPAEAIEVQIGIPDDYNAITSGDWTANIKSSLIDKLIDLGQEVTFLIPWEGGSPIVGTGIINYTLPNPPVYIGNRTTIFLKKKSQEELSEIKRENLMEQAERVKILEKQIRYESLDIITKIKHGNYPQKGLKYKFSATNPRKLFDSITSLLKGLKVIEPPFEQTYDSEKQDYFASVVYFMTQETSPLLIDLQIMASESSGSLLIWITGENEDRIQNALQVYDERITQLKEGLEEKVEVMSIRCPECGAQLPINDMDLNGMVECRFCDTISRIPKAMRY